MDPTTESINTPADDAATSTHTADQPPPPPPEGDGSSSDHDGSNRSEVVNATAD